MDRREPELTKLIKGLERELDLIPAPEPKASTFTPTWPKAAPRSKGKSRSESISLFRQPPRGHIYDRSAFWLERSTIGKIPGKIVSRSQWWLPPVIWPDEDKKYRSLIKEAVKKGAREFVLNAPWQAAFFEDRKNTTLVAGPYCNASNRLALGVLKDLGCSSAIINPELPLEDIQTLSQKPASFPRFCHQGAVALRHFPFSGGKRPL